MLWLLPTIPVWIGVGPRASPDVVVKNSAPTRSQTPFIWHIIIIIVIVFVIVIVIVTLH
jgi:t-SNARE complex subunit (syntaxin)